MVDLPVLAPRSEFTVEGDGALSALQQETLGVGEFLRSIGRRSVTFLALFAAMFAIAAAIVFSLRPQYTSDAMLMLQLKQSNLTDLPAVISPASGVDAMDMVRSEVDVLESDGLARQVVRKLKLDTDPAFQPRPTALSLISQRLKQWLGFPPPRTPTAQQGFEAAVGQYRRSFSAYNDGRSLVIQASFNSDDPALSQRILEAHLSAYLDNQMAAKKVVIARALAWLNGQLAEMRSKVLASEGRLQEMVNNDHLGRTQGDTIAGHELADASAELDQARNELARKEARLQTLGDLARHPTPGAIATSSDVLDSPLIQQLREQEAQLSGQVAQLSDRLGANHPLVAAGRAALANVDREIRVEIDRIYQAASNDVAVARTVDASAAEALTVAERHMATQGSAEVTIGEMRRELDAERTLYADLLSRSKQIAIQGEIQEPDARIVSAPILPLQPSFPRRGMMLAVCACVAAALAGAFVLLLDRIGVRSASLGDIQAFCGLGRLGVVPRIRRLGASPREVKLIKRMSPQSHVAAALQMVRNSIVFSMLGEAPAVICLGSALAGEGKTTLAVCLGYSLAQAGKRVLLVDADLRRRGLSRLLAPKSRGGLAEVLAGRSEPADHIVSLPKLDLDVFPAGTAANPHDLLNGAAIRSLLRTLRATYDVVVIDTPPLSAVDDALGVMRLADATAIVVRWRYTPYEAIREASRRLSFAQVKVAGAVLNAVDTSRYRSYAAHRDLEAYSPTTRSYFLR